MEETPIPPAFNKRAVNNNKGSVYTSSQEMDRPLANQDKSPPKKKQPPSKPSTLESPDVFQTITAGGNREITSLFSEFSEMLSERAAADSSQMKELDDILTETRNLEAYLREKKQHLRQTLTFISDKLLG